MKQGMVLRSYLAYSTARRTSHATAILKSLAQDGRKAALVHSYQAATQLIFQIQTNFITRKSKVLDWGLVGGCERGKPPLRAAAAAAAAATSTPPPLSTAHSHPGIFPSHRDQDLATSQSRRARHPHILRMGRLTDAICPMSGRSRSTVVFLVCSVVPPLHPFLVCALSLSLSACEFLISYV